MLRFLSNPRFLLPLIIFVGILVVGMHIGNIWDVVSSGKTVVPPSAMAETKNETAPAPSAQTPATSTTDKSAPVAAKPETVADKPAITPPPQDTDMSPAEMQLLEQLSQRRDQLDKRAKDLDTREALMKIADQRLDQKIKEMTGLRAQLQTMVSQLGEAQAAQTENLVKIYETMKPDEAARIFETLDMPVLLGVIQRMKPARTAPIMAKMAPEKAKELTIALTKQDQLPQVK